MNKYPFWLLKRDALRLLKGKWNACVLSFFIPFLIYFAMMFRFSMNIAANPSVVYQGKYMLYLNVGSLLFSVIFELVTAGVYHQLEPTVKKASCIGVYIKGFKSVWKLLPMLLLGIVFPVGLGFLIDSSYADRFYDYLMFSLMDYSSYQILLMVLMYGVQFLSLYLKFSLMFTPCILVHHPEYSGVELIRQSFHMSRGNKVHLFFLSVSFIGWMILGTMAFIIGILWATLYMTAAIYAYYRRLLFQSESMISPEFEE